MAFTYDESETADSNIMAITAIRREIGDFIENDGILPGAANFQDDQLLAFYAAENSHTQRAAANALESAARRWSTQIAEKLGNMTQDPKTAAANLRAEAQRLRDRYGYATQPANRRAGTGSAQNTIYPG